MNIDIITQPIEGINLEEFRKIENEMCLAIKKANG